MYHDVKVSITAVLKMMGCCFGKIFKISLSWNHYISKEFKFISGATFHEWYLFLISVTIYLSSVLHESLVTLFTFHYSNNKLPKEFTWA